AYILWADALGFLLLAPLVLAAWLWALGLRPLPAAALAIVASLVIWFAFYKLLRVPLPWGVLGVVRLLKAERRWTLLTAFGMVFAWQT
ncbi:MAG: hypothetical protein IPO82_09700, partial [Betaproteobacteria bacterium]|nr:hypothetical protein [Betaproteobacteria bacterium]